MRKTIIAIVSKIAIVVIVASLTASTVILALALYDTHQDNDELTEELNEIREMRDDLASNADESQTSLQGKVDSLESQIEALTNENELLQATATPGSGRINGQVAQIITSSDNAAEYQVVCAQDNNNESLLYCVSIPSVRKSYSLLVPAGEYTVFATPLDDNEIGSNTRAYFTEYVACIQAEEDSCRDNEEIKAVQVTEGSQVSNIDPIDVL